jgi:hypothetical protein
MAISGMAWRKAEASTQAQRWSGHKTAAAPKHRFALDFVSRVAHIGRVNARTLSVPRDPAPEQAASFVETLDKAWRATLRVFLEASPETRMPTLCMMASIASRYPAGRQQEAAQARLASVLQTLDLSADELSLIRYFQADP